MQIISAKRDEDGAEGGTCATRGTRGTIDFQARDSLELRDKEFAKNFHVAFKSGALKVAFKEA